MKISEIRVENFFPAPSKPIPKMKTSRAKIRIERRLFALRQLQLAMKTLKKFFQDAERARVRIIKDRGARLSRRDQPQHQRMPKMKIQIATTPVIKNPQRISKKFARKTLSTSPYQVCRFAAFEIRRPVKLFKAKLIQTKSGGVLTGLVPVTEFQAAKPSKK